MCADTASVRVAVREDIPAMHRIRLAVRENRLADPARVTEADYVREIEETGRGWVARAGGEIVGFAIGRRTDGNVWALFVDPAHEGRGYGSQLHDAMLAWLASAGVHTAWLTTEAASRAEGFYVARGWLARGDQRAGERRLERVLRRA